MGYAGLGTSLASNIANPLIGYSLLGDPNDIFAKATDEAFNLQPMQDVSVLGPVAGTVDMQPQDVFLGLSDNDQLQLAEILMGRLRGNV